MRIIIEIDSKYKTYEKLQEIYEVFLSVWFSCTKRFGIVSKVSVDYKDEEEKYGHE